jgi:hypothetical protein
MSLSLRKRIPAALTWAVLAASPALADEPQPGFILEVLPYPGQALTATLSTGEIVAFDGQNLDLYADNGDLINNLVTLPEFVFGSFLLVDPTDTFVVLGESSNHDILRIDLNPIGIPVAVANLVFNFDAVFEDQDTLLVSAASCGFGCGNEIFRVGLTTGSVQLIARVSGASGPLALDGAGNLYYGTASGQFPPPPNHSEVIRWDASQLHGGPVVSQSDSTLIATGLEGASDLVFDPVGGGLYLAANDFGSGVNVIRQILGSNVNDPILVEGTPFNSIGGLEFVPGDGQAEFAGYQPVRGGTLTYNTTDFFSIFERRSLAPRRPQLTIGGPGATGAGVFTVEVTNGPPSGSALLYYGSSALFDPLETVIQLRVPLFVGLDLPSLMRAPGTFALDATGTGSRDFVNPGGLEGQFAIQLLMLDDIGRIAGMSLAGFL